MASNYSNTKWLFTDCLMAHSPLNWQVCGIKVPVAIKLQIAFLRGINFKWHSLWGCVNVPLKLHVLPLMFGILNVFSVTTQAHWLSGCQGRYRCSLSSSGKGKTISFAFSGIVLQLRAAEWVTSYVVTFCFPHMLHYSFTLQQDNGKTLNIIITKVNRERQYNSWSIYIYILMIHS